MSIDGQRAAALWPPHYTATFAPLTILDDQGRVVARDGDALTTAILGPVATEPDSCGLVNVIELYFDRPT